MEKFEYRRQFIAGSRFCGDERYWEHVQVTSNLKLSVHKDLPLNKVYQEDRKIFLLGYVIDPFQPDFTDSEILDWLIHESPDLSSLIENTYRLSGRWVIIFVQGQKVFFFHDPFGMRQIYYAGLQGEFWCGSEPSILAENLNVKPDKTNQYLNEFIQSSAFKKKEHFWIGDKTRYKEIRHLLPNHFIDVNTANIERFWINHERNYSVGTAAKKAGELLRNSLLSASKRFNLMMPVTAGWDSRVLLAASKDIKDDLYYFISTKNHLTKDNDDVKIPMILCERLGMNFHVLDNLREPDSEFLKLLNKNVDMPRQLPKTLTFYEFYRNHQDKVNINGRGAETARCYYPFEKNPTAEFLAKVTGYPGDNFAITEIKRWLEKVRPFLKDKKIDLIDFYYWEHRMGNWGGTDPAEQDVAIEEFCPFNNRKLMMILLSTKRKYRSEPNYKLHKEMIYYLWSELLAEPINPVSTFDYLKKYIKSKMPYTIKRKIKRGMGVYPYN